MWNRRNDERGSGGPVLRDPLANKTRPQPYISDSNFKYRQQDNGNNYNFNRNVGNTNKFLRDQSQFPPVYDETVFPPTPAPFFHKPEPPAQVTLGSVLGRYSGLPIPEPLLNANVRGNEPAVPRFHGFPVQPQHGVGNHLENASFQNIQTTAPLSLLPTPTAFQIPGLFSQPLSVGLSQNFDNDRNDFGVRRQPETLDLQPQWSIQNEDTCDDDQESTTDSQQNVKQTYGFERRPFNKVQQQNSGDWAPESSFNQTGFERRPFNNNAQQKNSVDWASDSSFNQTEFERRPFNNNAQRQSSGDRPSDSPFNQTGFERRPFNTNAQKNSGDRTDSPVNHTGFERRPFNTNALQQNNGDQISSSSFDQTGFERRPFNNNVQQQNKSDWASTSSFDQSNSNNMSFSAKFERRPNSGRQPILVSNPHHNQQLQAQESAPTPGFSQHQRPNQFAQFPSFGGQRTGNVNNQSNFNQNTQQPLPPESRNQNHNIPSLLSLDPQPQFNSSNNSNSNSSRQNFGKKGKKFNQNQKFQKNQPSTTSGPPSSFQSNGKSNNINLASNKKLIPYPPPPLNPKSSNPPPPTTLLRNPRGILKNSSTSDYSGYSNFVKEGNTDHSPSASSSVVPYAVNDDDDDDDIEFVSEVQNSGGSSSSMTHDFFSEKMVQHFASIFNGKPLEEQLDELLKYLVLPSDFLSTRVSIVRNLHLMLRETFKKSILHPYGADFVGVGNSDDSVNVFVDLTGKQGPLPQINSVFIEPSDVTKENLEELLNLIQEDKNHKFFGQIVRRTNFSFNRINLPVISFIHSETKVRCNLRLDNYLLVQEAKIVQFVCSLDTRIPSLLSLARYWSSVHKVLDTPEEDTKNRFVTLLMLFFLARKKIIPTMAKIQSLSVKREYFNNLDIGYSDDYSLVPQNENPALEDKTVFTLSCLALLKEFFKLFAEAKLKDEVVSLWQAEFIPKDNFSPNVEGKVLSPELRKRYRFGADGKLRNKRIDCGSRLCIQDFQDLTENLSLSVAEYDISKFQVECGEASKKIESIMLSGAGNLMDLFVVSEYASYGTPEHASMHKIVYLLYEIADERDKRIAGIQQSSTDICETSQ